MLWLTNSTVRPPVAHVPHLAEALALELGVADGQDLVDDQDLRLQVRGDGERQPHLHPAAVALHRRVEELLHAANSTISSNFRSISRLRMPEDRAVQVDVLAAGQLGVEAGADLEQAADAAADVDAPLRRLGDPREDLQQRALAGPVAADDADHLAFADLEGGIPQCPEDVLGVGIVREGVQSAEVAKVPERRAQRRLQRADERVGRRLSRADSVGFRQLPERR